ncbi:AAA family ATPase [Pacificimonas sp. WHA3]|uniref:AAA family ATPase n=1 Tax=Pacificimonas pallii TaxID=2827236 RepID=A0ABS6SAL8_9SPHN|nr:division plane positioning ATPase MipZ [Pacificimonas pallii]MBV7255370.1 AAA family ATPase [Pacificimonas pallii]
MPHIITFGNEKGGTGKSTTAVHIAIALMSEGHSIAAVDLDARQRTFARYMENRRSFSDGHGLDLSLPEVSVIEEKDDGAEARLDEAFHTEADYLIIDTPGRDSILGQVAMARADTLVTPMNDSFVDFDLIGQVDAETFKVKRPSFYAEMVWKARKDRAKHDAGTVDWLVVRNRLAHLAANNMVRVGKALNELAPRIGFRISPGLSERVIYRELFPRGLTLLDLDVIDEARLSHVAARAELRALVAALNLPDRDNTEQKAEAA